MRGLYRAYVAGSIKRGYNFELSEEEFRELTSMKCVYCGSEPSNVYRNEERFYNGNYIYNGIDRVDNTQGYSKENCVPCCKKCNYMKRNLTYDDFIDHCRKIAAQSCL